MNAVPVENVQVAATQTKISNDHIVGVIHNAVVGDANAVTGRGVAVNRDIRRLDVYRLFQMDDARHIEHHDARPGRLAASRNVPGPLSARFVTTNTFPPRPPKENFPPPSAPGNAGTLACGKSPGLAAHGMKGLPFLAHSAICGAQFEMTCCSYWFHASSRALMASSGTGQFSRAKDGWFKKRPVNRTAARWRHRRWNCFQSSNQRPAHQRRLGPLRVIQRGERIRSGGGRRPCS